MTVMDLSYSNNSLPQIEKKSPKTILMKFLYLFFNE